MPQDCDLRLVPEARAEPAAEDIQEPTDQQVRESAQHQPTLLDTTRGRLMTPFKVGWPNNSPRSIPTTPITDNESPTYARRTFTDAEP
jgi:hypothetical protein